MTRRLVLAWSTGASLGYVVGWLAGSNVLRMAEGHRLARPGPRTPARTGVETREAGNGAQAGAQPFIVSAPKCGNVDPYSLNVCARERGHRGSHATGLTAWSAHVPCPVSSPTRHLPCIRVGAHDEHWWRDPRPACPQYSPGGGIPCSVKGPHTAHIFLGTHARDAKDDADERIE